MAESKPKTARSFRDIALHNNNALAALYRHSQDILKIQNIIKDHLGTPLNQHFSVANYGTDSLIIVADSPVWASRLRFRTAEILQLARNTPWLQGLRSIRIKINPRSDRVAGREKPPAVSPETRRLLRRVAENTTDSRLKAILLNIAGNN